MIPEFYESIKKPWGKDSNLFSFNDPIWETLENKYVTHCRESVGAEILIPKIIHQIWLGCPIPINAVILSDKIKELNKEWDFKLWTDQNIDFIDINLRNKILNIKNFGVQSDILRYLILEKYGGIYFDCDFLPIKNLDNLLRGTNFVAGICNPDETDRPLIANGLIAATVNHKILQKINLTINTKIEFYSTINNQIDIFNNTGPTFFTNEIVQYLKIFPNEHIVIYPSSYFYPINYRKRHFINSKLIKRFTFPETYLIHLWNASWFENKISFLSYIKNIIPLRYLNVLIKIKNFIK
jgi:mannosyltransferase OCH1-like enzyme